MIIMIVMIVMIMIECNDHDDCLSIGVKYHITVDIAHDHNDCEECYDYVMIIMNVTMAMIMIML